MTSVELFSKASIVCYCLFIAACNVYQNVKVLHYGMENFEAHRALAVSRKSLRGGRHQALPLHQAPCLQVTVVIWCPVHTAGAMFHYRKCEQ